MTQGQVRDLTRGPKNSGKVSPARCQATYDGLQGDERAYRSVRKSPASVALFRGESSEVTVGLIALPPSFPVASLKPSIAPGCERVTVTVAGQRLTLMVKDLSDAELPKPPAVGVQVVGLSMSIIQPDGGEASMRIVVLSENGLTTSVVATGEAAASSNDIALLQWRTAQSRLK